jgi:glycosyltransferase involved in cell wall biosynthesis
MSPPPRTIAIIAGQLVLGGAERQLHLWLSHLDRDRFRPVVVTLHPDEGDYWERSIEELGVPLLRVPRRVNRLGRLWSLVAALRPHRPDLVHGWHLFASPYAGAAGKLLRARASLGSLRGSFDAYRRQRAEAVLTECLVDGILVNSRSAGERLAASRGGRRKKIFTLPNAVEDRVLDHSRARARWRERWGIPGDRFWIGSVGRLDPGKRFDQMIDLGARLAERGEDVHVVVVGDGPERGALEECARRRGLADRTTFTGAEPDVRETLGALDLFCFPSADEGLPNAVMEAAAAGVPVVAWRTPFLEELLGAEGALLAERGDFARWESDARALLRDAERRRGAGEAARRRVLERFSVPRFVAGLTAAYDELLGAAAS